MRARFIRQGVPSGWLMPWRAEAVFSQSMASLLFGTWFQPSYASGGGTLRGRFCALPGGAGFSQSYFFTLWAAAPKPPTPPAGPPFCWQKGGKDHQRGTPPLGTPTGKQTAGCGCAGPKDRACLRNRSLVVPDKVPPADLYVESQAFYC